MKSVNADQMYGMVGPVVEDHAHWSILLGNKSKGKFWTALHSGNIGVGIYVLEYY
jgi:hypothetical protein